MSVEALGAPAEINCQPAAWAPSAAPSEIRPIVISRCELKPGKTKLRKSHWLDRTLGLDASLWASVRIACAEALRERLTFSFESRGQEQ